MKKLMLAILFVACVSTGGVVYSIMPNPNPKLGLSLLAPCLEPTDTINLRVTIIPVLDRRGQAVQDYIIGILQNGALFSTDTTTQTSLIKQLTCPQFGDSTMLQASARARDIRGNVGEIGMSNVLIVKTHDPGPVAPPIIIDTLEVALDSIRIYAFGDDAVTLKYIQTGEIAIGDSIQFCPLVYPTNGTPGLPLSYKDRCTPRVGMQHYHFRSWVYAKLGD